MAYKPTNRTNPRDTSSSVSRERNPPPWSHVIRAEGKVVLYSKESPVELLEMGEVLGIDDFIQAAEIIKSPKGMATRALKSVIRAHGEHEPPFSFWPDLGKSTEGRNGICSSFGYVGIKLEDFYAKTQGLYDCFYPLSRSEGEQVYGARSRQLLEALLFDIGPSTPLRPSQASHNY